MNADKKDWLHPAFAPLIIFGWWCVGSWLRENNFPRDFSPGSFMPGSTDRSIALLDASICVIAYLTAGYLIARPSKRGGSPAWWALVIVVLMMVAEVGIKVMSMALSLNYDYWVYVERSLPRGGYVLLPSIGLGCGLLLGGIGHWRKQRA